MADSLILMVLALVVFGPRRLPQIGRQIGKLMYEFRKASNDFKFQMEEELRVAEDADRRKKEEEERLRSMALAAPAQSIEAEADIGAVEPATTSPYPGEGTYPPQYPVETHAETHQAVTLPRVSPPTDQSPKNESPKDGPPTIQPPLTGEQVSAAPPAAAVSVNATVEGDAIGEASTIAEPTMGADLASVPAAKEVNADQATEAKTLETEQVDHHG